MPCSGTFTPKTWALDAQALLHPCGWGQGSSTNTSQLPTQLLLLPGCCSQMQTLIQLSCTIYPRHAGTRFTWVTFRNTAAKCILNVLVCWSLAWVSLQLNPVVGLQQYRKEQVAQELVLVDEKCSKTLFYFFHRQRSNKCIFLQRLRFLHKGAALKTSV